MSVLLDCLFCDIWIFILRFENIFGPKKIMQHTSLGLLDIHAHAFTQPYPNTPY